MGNRPLQNPEIGGYDFMSSIVAVSRFLVFGFYFRPERFMFEMGCQRRWNLKHTL